jgi:hypothetical protein
VYSTQSKCRGTYDNQSIKTNAMCMYGLHSNFDRVTVLITRISSYATTVDDKSPMYVPFVLKQSHPEIYGQYLAQQNAFLESHHNIAIVGIHPEVTDYGDVDSPQANFPDSICNTLSKMTAPYS